MSGRAAKCSRAIASASPFSKPVSAPRSRIARIALSSVLEDLLVPRRVPSADRQGFNVALARSRGIPSGCSRKIHVDSRLMATASSGAVLIGAAVGEELTGPSDHQPQWRITNVENGQSPTPFRKVRRRLSSSPSATPTHPQPPPPLASINYLADLTPPPPPSRRASKSRLDMSLVPAYVPSLDAAIRTADPALVAVIYRAISDDVNMRASRGNSDFDMSASESHGRTHLLTPAHRTAVLSAVLKHPDPSAGAAVARRVVRDAKEAVAAAMEAQQLRARTGTGDPEDHRADLDNAGSESDCGLDARDYYLAMRAELRAGNHRGVRLMYDDMVRTLNVRSTVASHYTSPPSPAKRTTANTLPHHLVLLASCADLGDVSAGQRVFADLVWNQSVRQKITTGDAAGKGARKGNKQTTTEARRAPALLIDLYSRSSMPGEAIAVLEDVVAGKWNGGHGHGDRRAYEAAIRCVGNAGVGAGGNVGRDHAKRDTENQTKHPNTSDYATGLDGARIVFRHMLENGIRPGAETFEALINVCELVALSGGGIGQDQFEQCWKAAWHYVVLAEEEFGSRKMTPGAWASLLRMAGAGFSGSLQQAPGTVVGATSGKIDKGNGKGIGETDGMDDRLPTTLAPSPYYSTSHSMAALQRAHHVWSALLLSGASPDRSCYEAYISVLDERGEGLEDVVTKLLDLVMEMKRKGVERGWRVVEAERKAMGAL
ncbi:hypothetical protein HDU93_000125 [Gonapodya sp. JEL0774]|nr:hypothetical protein HDU93_000125 [Gonapodya sp. JEL0774]